VLTRFDSSSHAHDSQKLFARLLVTPAMLVLLLVAVFPLIYLILVSFQGITMMDNSSDFVGLLNYRAIFNDQRLWEAITHTLIFLAIALPLELLIGLFMAQLFLNKLPGRQIMIGLLVLPVVALFGH
jgi:multiple sugar transport system permease protein